MTTKKKPTIVLVCTGLGRVQRGFEMYIASLAGKLSESGELDANLEVWSGGEFKSQSFKTRRIPNLFRNHSLSRRLLKPQTAFNLEQRSFALGMLPALIREKPAAVYLGEYQLYCALFKLRKLLRLRFSLVLYTGGQALPGLFDNSFDFVHHVTDRYLAECRHIQPERQFLVPHFFENDFSYNEPLITDLKSKAAGKKIVLSVGLLDNTVKRMDLLVRSLLPLKETVYPVLLGDSTNDTPAIKTMLEENFGKDGYLLGKVAHEDLGNYYKAAKLFVLCSPKESFGLAYVEALFHGLPMIADDFSEARFVLKDQAMFVDMSRETTLTQAIKTALENAMLTTPSTQRTDFAHELYSWEILSPLYKNLFAQVINNRPQLPVKKAAPILLQN